MFVDPGRALFAKRQRALSDGLMRKAQTMQPTHWAQGLNQLTAGLVGQHLGRKADAAEAEIAKEKQGRLSAMLEGPDGVNPAALAGLGYGDAAVQMALGDRRFDRQTAREDAVYGRQRADALADAERSRGYAVEDRDLARQWQVGDRDARQRFQMGMYDRRRADQLADAEAQQAQQPAADFGDGELKAAGFADRMFRGIDRMDEIMSAGFDPTDRGAGVWSAVLPDTLHSGDRKAFMQAADDVLMANLRLESGAAIGDRELDNARRTYIPQPGDTPEVVAQKMQGLRSLANNLRIQSSGAFEANFAQQPVAQSAPQPAQSLGENTEAVRIREAVRSGQMSREDGLAALRALGG